MRLSRAWVAGALIMALVTGCSGTSDGGTNSVELEIAYWGSNKTAPLQKLADQYTETHPGVTIRLAETPVEQYFQKMQTTVPGDQAPDLFGINGPNFQLYAGNGQLLGLGDSLASSPEVDLAKYPRGMIDLYRFDGEQHAMPENFATVALWYNKELFDAKQVSYPDDTWTWDDLMSAAEKLTDPELGIYGMSPCDTSAMAQECYYNTIAQAGGSVINSDGTRSGFADPEAIEGLQFWKDLFDAGVTPKAESLADTSPIQLFGSGKIAMTFGASWRPLEFSKSLVKDKVQVAPLPMGPAGRGTTVHGTGWAIPAKSKHPGEAWEFLKFLVSQEGQTVMGADGLLIPGYEGTQQAWLDSMPEYDLEVYIDALEYAQPYPVSKNTAAWQKEATTILTEAWRAPGPVDDSARKLAETMDGLLSKEA